MGTNIAGLKAKKLAMDEAFLAEDKKIKMQYDARQLNNSQRVQMIEASTKAYSAKSNDVKAQIATLELKRLDIERKYTMPTAAPVKSKPTKKAKP